MKRLLLRTVLALVVGATASASVLVSTQSPAAASTHSGPNWSWAGPASWDAAYGTYGITVLGDSGATLDLGFSSTLCASGSSWNASVDNYFRKLRRQLRSTGWDLDAGRIKHPSGFSATYRRQVLKGSNGRHGKTGQFILDYDFTTNVDGLNYCYQRSLAKYANSRSWKGLKRTLTQVQNSLAYSGPGALGGNDPDEF